MEINWRDIQLEDKEQIRSYYKREQSRSCELTFANNFLWAPFYSSHYAIVEGALVFSANRRRFSVSYPIGKEHVKEAMEALVFYFKERDQAFMMHSVTPEQFAVLQQLFPERFQINYERDIADYIYETEKLVALSGKKLHSKRNHVNKFLSEHDNWAYEAITPENKQECMEMVEIWREMNHCDEDPLKSTELRVTMRALTYMEKLGLTGGLLRLDGKVIAVSLGEECCEDTYVVHIEKAYADIPGAYPMINQQFAKHAAAGYLYINREDDAGTEGLRKAKLSYHPAFMQEKGIVTFRS